MAAKYTFGLSAMNWGASDPMKSSDNSEHVNFVVNGPLNKAEKKRKQAGLTCGSGMRAMRYTRLSERTAKKNTPPRQSTNWKPMLACEKINVCVCFRFHQRNQKDESFHTFLKELCLLAMGCVFTDNDEVLIDWIIVGFPTRKVQEYLLNEGEGLTLDKAILSTLHASTNCLNKI